MKRTPEITDTGTCLSVILTQGYSTLIDYCDRHLVEDQLWCAQLRRGRPYAVHTTNREDKNSISQLHRAILCLTDPGQQVDHANGNSLDNRRCNLRLATSRENAHNRKRQANNRTGYKGVWRAPNGKYVASLKHNGKILTLGRFDSPVDAALAYNQAACEHFGEFARTNTKADSIVSAERRLLHAIFQDQEAANAV